MSDSPILVVEDDPSIRYLVQRQLEKLGYQSTMALNGKEALQKLMDHVFELVIMDIQMPLMDGLEATREIRLYESKNGLDPVPIIAMTANPRREQCFEAGMNDFIFKPVKLNELRSSISKWISATKN